MKPLEDFQGSIKKMQAQCAQVSGAIDTQVKAVEQAEREEKPPACVWSTVTASGAGAAHSVRAVAGSAVAQ